MFSSSDDVCLVNPVGIIARGRREVEKTIEQASAQFSGGEIEFEPVSREVTAELAYITEIERWSAYVGGSEELSSGQLRVTSVLRPEEGSWKVVHRHADPIVPRPASSRG
jgi:ketosteroid isomerase-like protein